MAHPLELAEPNVIDEELTRSCITTVEEMSIQEDRKQEMKTETELHHVQVTRTRWLAGRSCGEREEYVLTPTHAPTVACRRWRETVAGLQRKRKSGECLCLCMCLSVYLSIYLCVCVCARVRVWQHREFSSTNISLAP